MGAVIAYRASINIMNKQLMSHWNKTFSATILGAALALVSLSGCNGGGSSSGQVPTTVYEGSALGFAGNTPRAGEVVIRSFSNNTVDGTLIVTLTAGSATGNQAGGVLPPGSYEFTGTVAGNSFTGQGRFLGSPSFTFTVNGAVPTTTDMGIATLSGSNSSGAFSVDLRYFQTTGAVGLNGNFTFSNVQNSNATTTPLNNTVNNGFGPTPIAGPVRLTGSFNAFNTTVSATSPRTLFVYLRNSRTYQVGDTLPIIPGADSTPGTPPSAEVFYSEGSPANKVWNPVSGSVKVTAIQGQKVTLQLINVSLEPSGEAGPNTPNQGTGTFTINGSGSVIVDKYPLTGAN